MHIKLIENHHKDLNSSNRDKYLKESINISDLTIMRASELLYDNICENPNGGFSDDDLIQTVREFTYVKKQFRLTNYTQFYVVYAPDAINYVVDGFIARKEQTVGDAEIQIFDMKLENYGNILFARVESNVTLYYFKSRQDINKIIDYINSNEKEG